MANNIKSNKNELPFASVSANDYLTINDAETGKQGFVAVSDLIGAASISGRLSDTDAIRVMAGIDSLTEGAFGSSAVTLLKPMLQAKYGNPGVGLVGWDLNGANNNGMIGGFYRPTGVNEIPGLATTDPIRLKSLGGRGVYVASGDGSYGTSFGFGVVGSDPVAAGYNVARVYYELRASGASFQYGQTAQPAMGTITTSDTAVGEIGILSIPLDVTAQININIYPITGAVSVYFVEFFKAGTTGRGLTVDNLGIGGTTLATWAAMDDTRFRAWMKLLRPDLFIMNAGMNDRAVSNPVKYGSDMDKVIARIQEVGTKVLLLRPNDAQDVASTYLKDYDRVLETVARTRGCAYIDVRDVPGFSSYTTADAAGLMGDGVHPNTAGNQRIADYLFDRISF